MFGLGTQELVIILFIILILFGGRKLPEIGSGIGKAIKNFRSATHDENKNEHKEIEGDKDQKKEA